MTVRFTRDSLEVPTTWAGVPTSFSAGGLTPFGHALKPDVMAPGAQILSSTLEEFAGDKFAILDGTSFSAPHVAGVAALLTQRHPSWTPQQVKSALMSTAGPAFADTTLTQEASVIVQGAGMVRVSVRRQPADLHRPAVALVRLPRRRGRREQPSDHGDGLGRGRRRRHMDRRGPGAGGLSGRYGRGGAGDGRPGRKRRDADRRSRVGGRRAGRQLRLRRPAAWKRRAQDPVRVLGLALVADGRSRHAAEGDSVGRYPNW